MTETQKKAEFEKLREALWDELGLFLALDKMYDILENAYKKNGQIFGVAPGFFTLVNYSLGFTYVHQIYRLAVEPDKNNRLNNIDTYLKFVNSNQELFTQKGISKDELEQFLSEDYETLKSFKPLFKKIIKLRGNYYAHFVREFSRNRKKLSQKFGIETEEGKSVVLWMREVFNRYSNAFDGHTIKLEYPNLKDVKRFVAILQEETNKRMSDSP